MGFFKSLSKYGLIPAVAIGNLLTAGIEKIKGKKYGRTTLEEASETKFGKVLGLATLGTGVLLGAVAAPAGTAKALIPKTVLGKTITTFAGGAALASERVRTAIVEAPFRIFELGKSAGEAVEDLPEEEAEEASGYGAGGLITAGVIGALIPKVIDVVKDIGADVEEVKDTFIEDIPELPVSIPEAQEVLDVAVVPEMTLEQPGELNQALLPETVDITPKKRKRISKKPVPSIRLTNKNIINLNNYCC